jgi:hypothetical protein
VAEIAAVGEVKQAAQGLAGVCSTVESEAYPRVGGAETLLMEAGPTSVGSPALVAVAARLEEDNPHVAAEENAAEDGHAGVGLTQAVLEGAVQRAHYLLMLLRAYVARWRSQQFY